PFDQVTEHLGRGPAHLVERLPYRGERRGNPARDRQVVESDDREVLRYPQAPLAGCLVQAERLLVAAGEDRRRRLGQGEQLTAAYEAGLVLEVAVADQRRVELDT